MSGEIYSIIIDWSKPIVAVPTQRFKGRIIPTAMVNPKYHRSDNHVPVKLNRNLWTDSHDGGTWYFTDTGLAKGGMSPEGYNGLFTIRNKKP